VAGVAEDHVQTPRVSVVMPVFDGETYIAEAIESVLGQTLEELELVVVDDGSHDTSRAIIERFAGTDSRVRLVINEKNLGISAALNIGWRLAHGHYIARVDADDVALPDRLSRQVEFLDAHPSVAMVGAALITIDSTGHRGSIVRFPTDSRVIHSTLPHHNCIAHPTAMLRRSALDEVGGYRFDCVEDYDLWLRLSERFKLANLSEPLVLYRIHAGQLSLHALETRERPRLAVRDSARARRASREDPLDGVIELTPAILDSIGLDDQELARAVEREWLGRAAILADLGIEGVRQLVDEASRTLGPRAPKAFAAARELKKAEILLGAGRPLAGSMHVLLAFWREPRYAFSGLTAWLGDHLRDRRFPEWM
jgi:hypothetical protein